ncbi:MAG: peptidyl-prolyl cis-trans isomerase [Deltaproteobacteria bacterium]|nr:peptidyl-prolyl cis-trans isomerase [Deltaproteobacteria bacterium]
MKDDEAISRLTALAVDAHLARQAEGLGLDQRPETVEALRRHRRAFLRSSLEEDLAQGIEISAGEIERSYRDHPERHRSPERLGTRFLLLRLAADASPQEVQETRDRILEIRHQVSDAASFSKLARLHSEAENGSRGGAVAASPRGSLLAAYEEVAWKLQPGEVSAPFRLPDGLALVFVEDLFEARTRTLGEASKGIESRLRHEMLEARRQEALAEARSRWPVEIRWLNKVSGGREPVVSLAGEQLTLTDLGLDHRPPRLEERLEAAISERWLFRLAEHRSYDKQVEASVALENHRRSLLAKEAIEARVGPRLPEVPESRLAELYQKRAPSFRNPEKRRFEVLLVVAEEGQRRGALAQAREIQRIWAQEGQLSSGISQPGISREVWGPLTASNLGNAVSPRLARNAFHLEPGQVSEPLVMERYSSQHLKFLPEGYVLLLPEIVVPSSIPSLEEARGRLRQHALRNVRSRLRDQAWMEAEKALPLVVDEVALARCEEEVE